MCSSWRVDFGLSGGLGGPVRQNPGCFSGCVFAAGKTPWVLTCRAASRSGVSRSDWCFGFDTNGWMRAYRIASDGRPAHRDGGPRRGRSANAQSASAPLSPAVRAASPVRLHPCRLAGSPVTVRRGYSQLLGEGLRWIPACAGMTSRCHPREGGDPAVHAYIDCVGRGGKRPRAFSVACDAGQSRRQKRIERGVGADHPLRCVVALSGRVNL